jgi:hypothetical protein
MRFADKLVGEPAEEPIALKELRRTQEELVEELSFRQDLKPERGW